MKQFRKLIVLMLTIALLVAMFIMPTSAFAAELGNLTGKVVVIHTNDTHSRVDEKMGYSRVTTLKKQYEAAGATVVLLDAGDVLHGLPIANLLKGENIVQILNKVGYDAFVPGNHDFNYGTDRLLEIAGKKLPNSQATTFGGKVLSANYVKTDDKSLPFDANVVIVRGGKKIGIFGLSTSETKTKSHPNNTAGYEFADNVATATAQRDALKAQGCDYIIALTHLGLDESSGNLTSKYLAENVTGLDLIVDGHSHSTLANGQLVNGTLIVSSGSYLANIGVVVLDNANKTASLVADKTIVEDVETLALVNKLKADTETGLAVVVGHTSVDLNGTRNYVRSGETNLGNFATDAMRVYGEADLAFTNGGGIRDNINKGDITKKHLVTVFPFGNYVVTKEVSVPVIKQMLEHGIKGYPSASGGFPHISGFSFTFDFTRPVGSKVTSITIGDTVAYDNGVYMPVPAAKSGTTFETAKYKVATNDFTAAGGDGYTMLGACKELGQYGALEEALIAYLATTPNMANYEKEEGRIVMNVQKDIVSWAIVGGNLVITYTDGTTQDLGKVAADNGTNGSNGTNGTNGANGADGANGANGANGKDANNTFGIVALILASVVTVGVAVSMVVLLKKKKQQ